MALSEVRGFVAQANAEIRAAEEAHQRQKAERQRLRRPIALIDGLINDLEVLNLQRALRVPLSYEPRLLQIREVLQDVVSADQLANLKSRVRPVKLMDNLYSLEEALLARVHPDAPRETEDMNGRPQVEHQPEQTRVGFDDFLQTPGLFSAA